MAWFDIGLRAFATGDVNWIDSDITAILVDNNYVPDFVNDKSISDIPESSILSETSLINKTVSGAGILDASDITFTGCVPNKQVGSIILALNTGNYETSTLLIKCSTEITFLTNGASIAASFPVEGVAQL